MNILLVGYNGKMGQKVVNCCKELSVNVVCGVDTKEGINKNVYKDFNSINNEHTKNIDVVLDFSSNEVLNNELEFCIKNNKPLVICSTGHNQQQQQQILDASKLVPIFKTANTSFGVAFLNKIITKNINIFSSYDIFVLEKHHKNKKDAPSGTALSFIQNLEKSGKTINCTSVRAGSVIGEHEIMLYGNGEQIYIKHIAEDRNLFAIGALKICKFMSNIKYNKLYTMEDVV